MEESFLWAKKGFVMKKHDIVRVVGQVLLYGVIAGGLGIVAASTTVSSGTVLMDKAILAAGVMAIVSLIAALIARRELYGGAEALCTFVFWFMSFFAVCSWVLTN